MPRAGTRAFVRPIGVAGIGLMTVLFAAWGGICVFVGPLFGYTPTSSQAWQWTMQNWLLHLVPGAVGVFAGLMMLGLVTTRGARRSGVEFAALLAMAAGIWFVIGPAVWPMFKSSSPYAQASSAHMDFLNQLGANLGPGLLLAILGGMAFKAGIAKPRVMLDETAMDAEPMATTGTTGMTGTNEYVPTDAPMTTGEPMARRDAVAEGAAPVAMQDPAMTQGRGMTQDPAMTTGRRGGFLRRGRQTNAPVQNVEPSGATLADERTSAMTTGEPAAATTEEPGTTGTVRGPGHGTMSPPSSPV